MDKYTFEMIPGLIGEIAELLRSIYIFRSMFGQREMLK